MALVPSYPYFPRTFTPKVLIHSAEPCRNLRSQSLHSLGSFERHQILRNFSENSKTLPQETALEVTKVPPSPSLITEVTTKTILKLASTKEISTKSSIEATTKPSVRSASPLSSWIIPSDPPRIAATAKDLSRNSPKSLDLVKTSAIYMMTTTTTITTAATTTATTNTDISKSNEVKTSTSSSSSSSSSSSPSYSSLLSLSSSSSPSSSSSSPSVSRASTLPSATAPLKADILKPVPPSPVPLKLTRFTDETDKREFYSSVSGDIPNSTIYSNNHMDKYLGAFSAFDKTNNGTSKPMHNGLFVSQIDTSFKCLYCCNGPPVSYCGSKNCEDMERTRLGISRANLFEKHLMSNCNPTMIGGGDTHYGPEPRKAVCYPGERHQDGSLHPRHVADFPPFIQLKNEPNLFHRNSLATSSVNSPLSTYVPLVTTSSSTASSSSPVSSSCQSSSSSPPQSLSALSPLLPPLSSSSILSVSATPLDVAGISSSSSFPSSLSSPSLPSAVATLIPPSLKSSSHSLSSSPSSLFSSSYSVKSSSLLTSSFPFPGYYFYHNQQETNESIPISTLHPNMTPASHLPMPLSSPPALPIPSLQDNPDSSHISLQPPPFSVSSFQHLSSHSLPPHSQTPLLPSPSLQQQTSTAATAKELTRTTTIPQYCPSPPKLTQLPTMCIYSRQSLLHCDRGPFFNGSTSKLSKLKTRKTHYLKRNNYQKSSVALGRLRFSSSNRNTSLISPTAQDGYCSQRSNGLAYKLPTKYQQAYIERRHAPRTRNFHCPYCIISCSNRGQLQGHIRIHTGERPFVCKEPDCGKAFIRNEELTRHRRIHTGERPHCCSICQKAFTRKDHLSKHMKTHAFDRIASTQSVEP